MRENVSVPKVPFTTTPTRAHRRQMLLQVWLPLIITIIVVLAIAVLSVIGAVQGSSQIDRWGSIAAIWVIIPVLIVGIVLMAIVGGLAFGVAILVRKTPGWMLKAQLLSLRIALIVRRAADAATKPVVKANTLSARAVTLWDRIFHRNTTVR